MPSLARDSVTNFNSPQRYIFYGAQDTPSRFVLISSSMAYSACVCMCALYYGTRGVCFLDSNKVMISFTVPLVLIILR